MIRHFIEVSFRSLYRNRVYSAINIIGLVLGVSVSFMLFVHVRHELSYESAHSKADRIYRVNYTTWAKSSLPLAENLMEFFPSIEQAGRIMQWNHNDVMIHETTHVPVGQGFPADQSILDIFDFEFVHGNKSETLIRPNTILLTESLSGKLFHGINPVGQSIQLGSGGELEVTGVMKDLPDNTHLEFEYLISMPSLYNELRQDLKENKGWMSSFTYILVRESHDIKEMEARLRDFQYTYLSHFSREEIDNGSEFFELYPVKDIHLHSHKEQEISQNRHLSVIYLLSSMGILIILIACVNFINLFATQLLKRSREVGLRKAIGAGKNGIVIQFLTEGMLLMVLTIFISLALCGALIPQYNLMTGMTLSAPDFFVRQNLAIMIFIVALVFFIGGGLPALFVANFKPVNALKGTRLPTSSLFVLRKRLVVFQFVISIFMIISTITVYRQMEYLRNKNLGFEKENVMSIQLYGSLWKEAVINKEIVRTELKKSTLVKEVANVASFFGNGLSVESLVPGGIDSVAAASLPSKRFIRADEGFVPLLELEIVAGRNFDPLTDPVNDSTSIFLINETTARLLNLDEPVGMEAYNGWTGSRGKIVGVLKDFNYASLHFAIEPVVIEYRPFWVGTMLVRLEAGKKQEAIQYVQATIAKLVPNYQLIYTFLDDNLDQMYADEHNIQQILVWFSLFAVLIACLGLFALSAYMSETRTKEVGIRKVLGSSIFQIILLFSRDYVRMIFIAFIIAVPIAYFIVSEWLTGFAYQVIMEWWMFALAGLLVVLVAMFAVGAQIIRTAGCNPTECLRSE